MPDAPAERLLADLGYADIRRFFEMAIEFDDAPPPASLPDGFTLHVATPDDGRAFHAAVDEAFQDHWEHHSRPFDEWWQTPPRATLSWTSPGGS